MVEHSNKRERIIEREHTTQVTERSAGTGIAAVVGGLVVAVLVVIWLIGGFDGGGAEVSETRINLEETETATGDNLQTRWPTPGTEAETAPEPNAETAPAPEPDGAAEQPADGAAATE